MKKTYRGESGGVVHVVIKSGFMRTIRRLHHVVLHSPSGFDWGYEGSGPADLALSILCDVLKERPSKKQIYHGDFKAYAHHQDFKREFVSRWDMYGGFQIDENTIVQWLLSRGIEV